MWPKPRVIQFVPSLGRLRKIFDLVLCGVKLTGMDGLSFLRRFRAEGGSALMIMLSPQGMEDAALAALREGAYDYVHLRVQAR